MNPARWKPATIFGIVFAPMAAMTSTSVGVLGMPKAKTVTPPTKTWSTPLERRTSSVVLSTASSVRFLGGTAQAPPRLDELEPHAQGPPCSEAARPDGRIRESAEPFLLSEAGPLAFPHAEAS